MSKIKAIITGHVNEALNREEILSKERLKVCENCPLRIQTIFGLICDSKRWLNPLTNEESYTTKVGFKKGCGCRLDAKTRTPDEKCPTGKW